MYLSKIADAAVTQLSIPPETSITAFFTIVILLSPVSRYVYAVVSAFIDDGIEIVDITDPTNPTSVGEVADGGDILLDSPLGIDIFTIGSSTYAVVVAQADNAMVIIDITTPSDPTVVSTTIDTDTTLLDKPINVDTISLPTDISSNEPNSVYAVVTPVEDGIQILQALFP